MSKTFTITREIGIDAGHRVMTHGSKCKNIHGHRYKIQVTCSAPMLISSNEQTGMVLDFGFLKDIMMEHIDEPCDHGLIMYHADPLLRHFFICEEDFDHMHQQRRKQLSNYYECNCLTGKLYVVDFIPTAENLAKHWWERLYEPVKERSEKYARIRTVTVHETPNCQATYEGIPHD